eukprot:GHVT01087917.1.p3 GENE.GHVT01087917.1~~GHVT01087917.1.p3  ORF type:complete len:112 (-),score=16.08 GHVT01087917.1:1141-1476(-)
MMVMAGKKLTSEIRPQSFSAKSPLSVPAPLKFQLEEVPPVASPIATRPSAVPRSSPFCRIAPVAGTTLPRGGATCITLSTLNTHNRKPIHIQRHLNTEAASYCSCSKWAIR